MLRNILYQKFESKSKTIEHLENTGEILMALA